MKGEKRIVLKKSLKHFLFIYIAFLTLYISNITFSKYVGVIGKSGNTTVAKWDVSIDTSDNSSDSLVIVSDSTTASYTVKVVSKSDVSARYSIVLSNVPTGLEVSLDGGTYITPTNNEIVFSNAGSFVANDSVNTHTHVLTFNDPSGNNNVGTHNVGIDVNIEQTH